MTWFTELAVIYFCVMTGVSIIILVADKIFAKKHMWRVPETTLILLGLLGGALPMYITMTVIRHKTKHKKFMIGLPIEIAIHVAVICIVVYLYYS